MGYPKDLMEKARFFADIEGKSLEEKITELLQGWIDTWEYYLETHKTAEKKSAKVIQLIRDEF